MASDMGGTLELWRIRTRGWTMMLIQLAAIGALAFGVWNIYRHGAQIRWAIQYPEVIELGDPLTKFGGVTLVAAVVLIVTIR